MNYGFIKRFTSSGTVLSQSVKNQTFFIRTSFPRTLETVYLTTPTVAPLSAVRNPRALMVSGGSSGGSSALPSNQRISADGLTLPTRSGGDTDGVFVTNPSLDELEGPVGVARIASEQKQTKKEHSASEPAVSAYKEVFSKVAMEGPGKSVGKVESHAEQVGKFEGKNSDVGKFERSSRKVEGVGKTVGNSEEMGKFEGKNVGKSVGKSEGKDVGKALRPEVEFVGKLEERGPNVGKSERSKGKVEGVGKSVGKSEEDTPGKVEQMGKSVGISSGKNVGTTLKTEGEPVGKSVGKNEDESVGKLGKNEEGKVASKTEGGLWTLSGKSVGKAAEADVGKSSDKSVGAGEGNDLGIPSQESIGHEGGKAGGNTRKEKTDSKEFVIAVAGKSESEISYAESLTSAAGELKLPEGATLVAYEHAALPEDGFRVGIFMDQLRTRQFGRLLFYAHELPSTHTLLSQNCKSLPVGTLSVADYQFQGKGRAGNSWESPKGCLMFSFTLQMLDGRAVPFLQYVASLAIIEAIESHCISKGLKSPEVKIKWPNDLYANGLKVGGVLCTSTYSSKKFNIVVGVGLNVDNRQPTTCLNALLQEINEEAPGLPRDELLAAIISKFENLFDVFCTQGFFALESDYYKRWLHSGQTVLLEEKQEHSSEVSHVPLKIQGLTPSGYLRAVDDASEAYELHPDGNSFDFLKGLMRKKM